MIGKLIGAFIGKRAASAPGGVSPTGGAVLGMGAAAMARRLGPIGLIAATVGGLYLKRRLDKRATRGMPRHAHFRS